MKTNYSAQIVWSKEDEAYLAATPELPGCVADGASPEEALANLRIVAEEWIAVAKEEGRKIPEPATVEDLEKRASEFQQQVQAYIAKEVGLAVQKVLQRIAEASVQSEQYVHYMRGGFAGSEFELAGGIHRR